MPHRRDEVSPPNHPPVVARQRACSWAVKGVRFRWTAAAIPSSEYRLRILGNVEVLAGERPLELGGRKPTALLALLALHANGAVSVDRLIDELWGDEPPRTARKSLQVHVWRLRRELADGMLETHANGYALRIERGQVDLYAFEDLAERGRAALDEGRAEEAADVLREALVLWRGRPLAGSAASRSPEVPRHAS